MTRTAVALAATLLLVVPALTYDPAALAAQGSDCFGLDESELSETARAAFATGVIVGGGLFGSNLDQGGGRFFCLRLKQAMDAEVWPALRDAIDDPGVFATVYASVLEEAVGAIDRVQGFDCADYF